MELKIDGRHCDLNPQTNLKFGWSAEGLQSVEALRSGISIQITLPATPENDLLLSDAGAPHPTGFFNRAIHRAEITHEEVVLFEGVVRLVESRPHEPERCYHLELRGGAATWAKLAARQRLDALPIRYKELLTPNTIAASWSGEQAVRFLPIAYDDYQAPYASESLRRVEQLLVVDDFYPFLHLKTLLEAVFQQSGYEVESNFMQGEFFDSLYISGAYRTNDNSMRKRRMDFLARRSHETLATADSQGRLFASPFVGPNTVGNLVDAFLPNTPDEEGNLLTDCFSTNGCFGIENQEILFRPLSEVRVGFEYHLHYETDYRILSRKRLQGFDSIYLGEGADFRFELGNRFEDRREELMAGYSYRLLIFDYVVGESFRLRLSSGEVAAILTARSGLVTLSASAATGSPTLERLNPATNQWESYNADWALYDGYVEERGKTEVEVILRTAAELLSPTAPKFFRHIYFYGAEEGMSFKLKRGTSLRPSFSSRPAYGEEISWADVAQLPIQQTELLDAVARLFNLCILSDESRKRVWIEPYADFYASGESVNWSDKLVLGSESFEQSDLNEHEARRYGYHPSDGRVLRLNEQLEDPFGEWIARSPSKAGIEGTKDLRNPLFAPTISENGHFESAPSALILRVGNRDTADGIENFEFTPRIVRYLGLTPLPKGERLGAPAPEGSYPLAAFHLTEEDSTEHFTLCFENRDGEEGLHRFHDEQEMVRNHARDLRVRLYLTPDEFEGLHHRSRTGSPGPESRFHFRLGEEDLNGRLVQISAYDPLSGCATLLFHLLPDDRP